MNRFAWIFAVAVSAGCVPAARKLVHYFQLESYQFPGYKKTLLRNKFQAILPGTMMAISSGVIVAIAYLLNGLPDWAVLLYTILFSAIILLIGILIGKRGKKAVTKKPLVITPRVKRLFAVAFVVFECLMLFLISLLKGMAVDVAICLFPLLIPAWIAVAGLLAWPIEKFISELYFRDAQRILRNRPDLIKIGITGSYGKTSVKFILGTLLAEKYQTLVTPSSFNTPMGVTKIIRNNLKPSHQVFVAEMGARHVGDIKEMCRLVHPKYGVLTCVGPQHLDTFKTIERIRDTKYELMDAIPEDGCCFFNDDGDICRSLYEKTNKPRYISSISKEENSSVWAENIRVSSEGSTFMLCTHEGSIECTTLLLGEHNIQNILLAASVCLHLGLTLQQIKRGVAKIQPVEHRMQLVRNAGGMTIIDDAFNSNPKSSQIALRVLKMFDERKIVITPGMVELGDKEAEFNYEFGKTIAETADIAILVGKKHCEPIRQGILNAGFDGNHLHVTSNLDEAASVLRSLAQPGDVVLFENDLPDNYSEN